MEYGSRERCAVSGKRLPTSDMFRFVLDPQNKVVCDLKRNLPVKAELWLHARRGVVEKGCKTGVFKTLDSQAHWPQDLSERIGFALVGRIVELLHLARRSGALVTGFDKCHEALSRGRGVAGLLQAADASVDGRKKLAVIAKATDVPMFDLLERSHLAAVTGQENQSHLVLKPGGLAEQILTACQRAQDYELK